MTFQQLDIKDSILKALKHEGYTHPTPIQEQAIPILLRRKDLLGCAQTGTGKTAAFAIPIIQLLTADKSKETRFSGISALVVTPTRELAIQIADSFDAYGRYSDIKTAVIFGGVKQGSQVDKIKSGVDVLIATPGRLLDLMNQGFVKLHNIKYFVLDEADQMLDMGFIHDIKRIIAKLPVKRQSLFFSATMPPSIVELSRSILGDYERVTIKPEQVTADKVGQTVYYVSKADKVNLLIHLLQEQNYYTTLVFARTKHGADKIAGKLKKAGIDAQALHGNKSQNARQRTLNDFKNGKTAVLVATDIAARGIDVDDLSLVINFDLPTVAETYVHRIGRTGRAKSSGIAFSFCDKEERKYLKDIEKLIAQSIPVNNEHPYVLASGASDDSNPPEVKSNHPKQHSNSRKYYKRRKTKVGISGK